MSRLIPKTLGIMNHEAYLHTISSLYQIVLYYLYMYCLFVMHPWPFQTKNSHVHEVRKHRHHNSDLLDLCQKGGKRKENAPTLKVNHFKSNLNERFFVSKESDSETFLPPS